MINRLKIIIIKPRKNNKSYTSSRVQHVCVCARTVLLSRCMLLHTRTYMHLITDANAAVAVAAADEAATSECVSVGSVAANRLRPRPNGRVAAGQSARAVRVNITCFVSFFFSSDDRHTRYATHVYTRTRMGNVVYIHVFVYIYMCSCRGVCLGGLSRVRTNGGERTNAALGPPDKNHYRIGGKSDAKRSSMLTPPST